MTYIGAIHCLLPALVLGGCIVAPCPPGSTCTSVSSGGASAGGAANGGGANTEDGGPGAGGGAVAGGGASGQGGAGEGGMTHLLPTGNWVNVTANLANIESECGTLGMAWAKPDEDLIIAGIALNGLWATTDGGGSWHALGTGTGSDTITNRPSFALFDPAHPKVFWESGLYNGGGVYKTTDDGVTWVQQGQIQVGPRLDILSHVEAISVDFSDPDRKTLLAGSHEQSQKLYRSTDGGASWVDVGANLPAGTCTRPLVISPTEHLVGCSGYNPGVKGILRSTDGAQTWTQVSSLGGGDSPLWASDGSIYWLNASRTGVARSADKGLTWKEVNKADVMSVPVELPDGRLLGLGKERVLLSADHGSTWQPVSAPFPTLSSAVAGFTYSVPHKALFIWHGVCGESPVPVPNDAILSYDFDYTTF